jgi:hypothetical protein
VNMMLGDGRREKSSILFFLEIRPHRGVAHLRKVPDPILVVAYGVSEAAPAAKAAPELPVLRERFNVRPSLTKGELAQKAGPIELVLAWITCSTGLGRLTTAGLPATTYIS